MVPSCSVGQVIANPISSGALWEPFRDAKIKQKNGLQNFFTPSKKTPCKMCARCAQKMGV